MLIDHTYFIRKINLPQRGIADGQLEIASFIEQYEPEFLQYALGYDLWKAFMTGLEEPVIEQRWLDLLQGKEYTLCYQTRKWLGFTPLSPGASLSIDPDNIFELTAGGPAEYDPVAGSATMALPPAFIGINFTVEVRGTGTLRKDEYQVVGDTLTLLDGQLFNDGATVFLKKSASVIISPAGDLLKLSPIANYVYYRMMEDKATDMTNIGTVYSQTDNNTKTNGVDKMIDAWNQMVDWLNDLNGMLWQNRSVYPEWKDRYKYRTWNDRWRKHEFLREYCLPEIFEYKNQFDL